MPVGPLVGEMLVTCGGGTAKNTLVFPDTPPTVAKTMPLVAPLGTVAVICVSDQFTIAAFTPANFSVLEPCVAPKLEPLIVTWVPTGPLVGTRLTTVGVSMVNTTSVLLSTLFALTFTGPVVAVVGTVTWIC